MGERGDPWKWYCICGPFRRTQMKQFFENLIGLKIKLGSFISTKKSHSHNISNSNNKTEYHFHGPVTLIQNNRRNSKRLKG